MPQATDITINNGAATPVAKTFTLLAPAAGYGAVAEWALKEGSISSVFPRVSVSARKTANNSSKALIKLRIPSSYTDSVTGLTKVQSSFECNIEVSIPDSYPENLKNDAVAFTANLLNHTLIKACVRDALPAT